MKLTISLEKDSLLSIMRGAGYAPEGQSQETGEYRFRKPLSGRRYPSFHLYAFVQDEHATLNLHLDQKQPSYEGSSAHSGEYEGPLVEQEAERIKSLL